VLGNDTDVDDDPLTAVLNGSVSHGVLALSPEGSFSYTPTAGYSGTDTFTYKANDGTDDSNVATVTITVTNDQPAACDYADKQSCQSDVDCAWEGNPRTGFCRETEPSCIPDSESESSCDDGIDNDCDTLVDGDDPDCSGSSVVCGDLTADGYDACKAEPTCRWSKKDERCVTK
jgi:VCBS repeat-containing protein